MHIFVAEMMKVRWWLVWVLIIAGPILSILQGSFMVSLSENDVNLLLDDIKWINLFGHTVNQGYGSLFLPVIIGVVASLLCWYEHTKGGWKQLLTLPISRWQIFLAKYSLIMLIAALMQLVILVGVVTTGMVKGYTGTIPWEQLLIALGWGWLALLPLAALQLWISFVWKSFAAPLIINFAFAIPTVFVAQSETLGPWYPWAQPWLAMIVGEKTWFSHSPESLYIIVLGCFVLFFGGGLIHFVRRDWLY